MSSDTEAILVLGSFIAAIALLLIWGRRNKIEYLEVNKGSVVAFAALIAVFVIFVLIFKHVVP